LQATAALTGDRLAFGVLTNWKNSREVFARILRRHGLEPDAVDDVEQAWSAFREFVQVKVGGIEPAADDGDGFVVQWGRWNEGRPALVFTRQFAVNDDDDRDDECWQPRYWAVELELTFAEDPAWADLSEMAWKDSMGFDFDPVGPERAAALARISGFVETLPQVAALWRATPVSSVLILDRAG
jgi:hypothetical protein